MIWYFKGTYKKHKSKLLFHFFLFNIIFVHFILFFLFSYMQKQSPIFAINSIELAKKIKDLTIDEFKELFNEQFKIAFRSELQGEVTSIAKTETEEGYINAVQAADFLKNKVSYIYQLVYKDEIPHYKNGRRLLFKKSELAKWVAEGK